MLNLFMSEFKLQFSEKEKNILKIVFVTVLLFGITSFSIIGALSTFGVTIPKSVGYIILGADTVGFIIATIQQFAGVTIPTWFAWVLWGLGGVSL